MDILFGFSLPGLESDVIAKRFRKIAKYLRVDNSIIEIKYLSRSTGYAVVRLDSNQGELFSTNALHNHYLVDIHNHSAERLSETLPPPFAFVKDSVNAFEIVTDFLGLHKFYINESRDGHIVASNHIGCGAILQGNPLSENVEAIRRFTTLGWFPFADTPYLNVRRTEPGEIIRFSPDGVVSSSNSFSFLKNLVNSQNEEIDLDHRATFVLEGLRSSFQLSASRVTEDKLTFKLSGGKDSRLVCAAAIFSGLKPKFHTIGTLEGEARTASELLSRVGLTDNHLITYSSNRGRAGTPMSLFDSVDSYFSFSDGDFTLNKIRASSHTHQFKGKITLGGGAGEVLRSSHYNTEEKRTRLENSKDLFRSISNGFKNTHAIKGGTASIVDGYFSEVNSVLDKFDFSDRLKALDMWHLLEKSRRWAPVGFNNVVAPFFNQKILKVAFHSKLDNVSNDQLFSHCIEIAVPEWSDVPFYKASAEDRQVYAKGNLRVWQDRDFSQVVKASDSYERYFDPAEVHTLYKSCLDNEVKVEHQNRAEACLMRVLWVNGFTRHLTRINQLI